MTDERHKKKRLKKTIRWITKRAELMRNYESTPHEAITQYILEGILKEHGLDLSSQEIFFDERNAKWYIVDFYIPKLAMVIEIDGGYHRKPERKKYDTVRTRFLQRSGCKVIRIYNRQAESLSYRNLLNSIISDRISELEELWLKQWKRPHVKRAKHIELMIINNSLVAEREERIRRDKKVMRKQRQAELDDALFWLSLGTG